jgi:hypothetical protein
MGNCIDCAQYTEESSFCSKQKTKKLPDASCRSFRVRKDIPSPKTTAEINRLNDLVTWMRSRGVIALKVGTSAITLETTIEPGSIPNFDADTPRTQEEIQAAMRLQRADLFYPGGVPRRKGDR